MSRCCSHRVIHLCYALSFWEQFVNLTYAMRSLKFAEPVLDFISRETCRSWASFFIHSLEYAQVKDYRHLLIRKKTFLYDEGYKPPFFFSISFLSLSSPPHTLRSYMREIANTKRRNPALTLIYRRPTKISAKSRPGERERCANILVGAGVKGSLGPFFGFVSTSHFHAPEFFSM